MGDFSSWQRAASENLIAATSARYDDAAALELLKTAADSGTAALRAATNIRERTLAMGLLQTIEGIRIVVTEQGRHR